MASWHFKPPGGSQIAVALMRDDYMAIHVVPFEIVFKDYEGCTVRVSVNADWLTQQWRRRR